MVGLLLVVLDVVGWFVLWLVGNSTGWFIAAGWPRGLTWTLVLVVALLYIAAGFWQMRRTPDGPISRQ